MVLERELGWSSHDLSLGCTVSGEAGRLGSARPRALKSNIHRHTRHEDSHHPWGTAAAGSQAGRATRRDHPAGACRSAVAVTTEPGWAATQEFAGWAHGGCLGVGGRGRTRPRGEMPRGGAGSRRSGDVRMGQPARRTAGHLGITPQEGTGGTETSQYPEEQRGFP
jgi:hypothetical protein